MLENLIKSTHAAAFLLSDLREAHKHACNENPIAEFAIFEMLQEVATLKNKVERFAIACGANLEGDNYIEE